jgi:uncharacterized membrane protein YqjE
VALAHSEAPIRQRWREAREELRELEGEAREIAHGLGDVARGEARLAVAEVRDGVRATRRAAILGAVAVAFGLVTLAWLPLPLLLGLNEAMPLWAASLVTVGVLMLISVPLALMAWRQFKAINFVPKEALERVKEDTEWLKQQLSRDPS